MVETRQEKASQTLVVNGETVLLLPQRGLYWPRQKTLAVADLHWGKSETFQAHGIPVSSQVLADDLARLKAAIENYHARQVLILGDLIHTRAGITDAVSQEVSAWRQSLGALEIILIRGNHDRALRHLPPEWDIGVQEEAWQEGPFVFAHAPDDLPDTSSTEAYLWCGHIHPSVRLQNGRESLRLPCFYLTAQYGVLPAFGQFTGGYDITPSAGEQIFVIAEDQVVAWH